MFAARDRAYCVEGVGLVWGCEGDGGMFSCVTQPFRGAATQAAHHASAIYKIRIQHRYGMCNIYK